MVKWRESVAYAHNFRKGEGLSWKITQIADYHHRPVRELAWREENLLVFRCVWELAGLLWERLMRIFKKNLKKNTFISCFYKMYLLWNDDDEWMSVLCINKKINISLLLNIYHIKLYVYSYWKQITIWQLAESLV